MMGMGHGLVLQCTIEFRPVYGIYSWISNLNKPTHHYSYSYPSAGMRTDKSLRWVVIVNSDYKSIRRRVVLKSTWVEYRHCQRVQGSVNEKRRTSLSVFNSVLARLSAPLSSLTV